MTLFELTEPLTRDLPFPLSELADAPTRVVLVTYPVRVKWGTEALELSVRWKLNLAVEKNRIAAATWKPSAIYRHLSESRVGQLNEMDDLLPFDLGINSYARAISTEALNAALDDPKNYDISAPVVTDHGDYPNFGPAPAIPGLVLPDQIYDVPDGNDVVGTGGANSARPDALDLWPQGTGRPESFAMITSLYLKHTPICDFQSGATWLLPSTPERLSCTRARSPQLTNLEDEDDFLIYRGRHRSVVPALSRYGSRVSGPLVLAFQSEKGALIAESQDDGQRWTISDLGLHDCRPLACAIGGDGNPFLLVLALGEESEARSYLPFDVMAVQLGRTGAGASAADFRDDDDPGALGDREFPLPAVGEKTALPRWQITRLNRTIGVNIEGARPQFASFEKVLDAARVAYLQNYPGEQLEQLQVFDENRAPLNRARYELGWSRASWTLVTSLAGHLHVSASDDGIDWKGVIADLNYFELIGSARDGAGRLHIMARRINGNGVGGPAPAYRHIRANDVAALTLEIDGDAQGAQWTLTQIERATGLPVLKADKNALAYYGGAWTVRAQVNQHLRVWRSNDDKLTWEEARPARDLPA